MKDLRARRDTLVRSVSDENRILIAAHRGSAAGNIVGNTINAYRAAVVQGADIVECDVSRTTDGTLLAFHDGGELTAFGIERNIETMTAAEASELRYFNGIGSRTKQRVQTLDEVFRALKGSVLINLDRGWESWAETFPLIERYDMSEQIILKSPVDDRLLTMLAEAEVDYMYIPIVRRYEEIEKAFSYDLNFLGVEIVFRSAEATVARPEVLRALRERGLLLWANAVKLNETDILADTFDDDTSILADPDLGWGRLLDMGFEIIQTDWPMLLRRYLLSRGIEPGLR